MKHNTGILSMAIIGFSLARLPHSCYNANKTHTEGMQMKAIDIMNELFAWAPGDYTKTCDTIKAGSPDTEVTRVAVCCFTTPQVVRDAADWGAQLLITHEPTYYDHWDAECTLPVGIAKRKFIESTGMAVYRYHDHPHYAPEDLICAGEIEALGLPGRIVRKSGFGVTRYDLDAPITPRQLAKHIEKNWDLAHVRIAGTTDEPCTRLALAWGTPGSILEELAGDAEIVLTGEACEWREAEYARDAAALGFKKALLVLGHCGSERDGMKYIASLVQQKFPQLEVRYFRSEEVYSYTDQ